MGEIVSPEPHQSGGWHLRADSVTGMASKVSLVSESPGPWSRVDGEPGSSGRPQVCEDWEDSSHTASHTHQELIYPPADGHALTHGIL